MVVIVLSKSWINFFWKFYSLTIINLHGISEISMMPQFADIACYVVVSSLGFHSYWTLTLYYTRHILMIFSLLAMYFLMGLDFVLCCDYLKSWITEDLVLHQVEDLFGFNSFIMKIFVLDRIVLVMWRNCQGT